MRIRYGYRIEIVCDHDLPLITLLDVHPSRRHDLVQPDAMVAHAMVDPSRELRISQYLDQFGNICRRLVAPAGGVLLQAEGVILDSGERDAVHPDAREIPPSRLPDEALVYL